MHPKGDWKKGSVEGIASSPALQAEGKARTLSAVTLSLLALCSLENIRSCSEASSPIPVPAALTCSLPPGSVLALSVQATERPEQAQDTSFQPSRIWQSPTDKQYCKCAVVQCAGQTPKGSPVNSEHSDPKSSAI